VSEVIDISASLGDRENLEGKAPTLLGLDYCLDGNGSILRPGLFKKPHVVLDVIKVLNECGLVDKMEDVIDHGQIYSARCDSQGREPIKFGMHPGCAYFVYACS
jgi:hypothetical protein